MVTRNFAPFPILTTQRLTLKQISFNDQQDIFALRSNPEINKYLERAPSKTVEDAGRFISMINAHIANNNSVYWVITLADTKTFVGTICLFAFSDEQNSCEIGFELMTQFQGKGMMKEAADEVVKYAFNTLNVQKIMAVAHNENQKSTKLLTSLGFHQAEKSNQENDNFNTFTLSTYKLSTKT